MVKDPHPHSLLSLKPFSIFLSKVLKMFTSGFFCFPQCNDCLLFCLPIFPISSPLLSGNHGVGHLPLLQLIDGWAATWPENWNWCWDLEILNVGPTCSNWRWDKGRGEAEEKEPHQLQLEQGCEPPPPEIAPENSNSQLAIKTLFHQCLAKTFPFVDPAN